MNKIVITMKELTEMMKIPEKKEEFVESWLHIIEKGFIWNEFKLKVKELNQTYKVKIEGLLEEQKIKINKIQYDDYGLVIKTYKNEVKVNEYLDKLVKLVKSQNKKDLKELYKENYDFIDILPPMAFIEYIIRESKNRKYEYVIIENKESKENKYKNKKQNIKSKQEYGLLDCIKIYQKKEGIRKKYEITCESWEVRGYFRHYKNGKVVWVKPFTKGKGKSKQQNEYKLRSKENEEI